MWRRDFTCNALYYNIEDFSIWDYVGGVEDVRARTLRLIGDPETRYREDPVRMLRAVRFEAKLGFTIHESARAPFETLAGLLAHIPPARLLDEFQKLFLAGFGQRSFDLLRTHGLLDHLFPATAAHLAEEKDGMSLALIRAGLANTDRRVAEDKSVTPMFLFAVLLFGPVSAAAQKRFETGMPPTDAIADAVDEIVSQQNRRIGIPKRFSIPMRELLALQPRFHRREGRRALGFLGHPRFRAAYDFFVLRAEAGGEDPAIARWWTEIQALPPEQQRERVGSAGGEARAASRNPVRAGVAGGGAAAVAHRPLLPRAERDRMAWRPAYVALGSNLSDPRRQVENAFEALASLPDARLIARSGLWRSAPLGPQDQPEFVNAAAGLLTTREPREFLASLQELERRLGKSEPAQRWGPRIIDLDLVVFADVRCRRGRAHPAAPGPAPAQFRAVSSCGNRRGALGAGTRSRRPAA